MVSNPYLIKGIQAGKVGNAIPLRREIDEWWFSSDSNDANQKSLFIHAMHKFQRKSLGLEPQDIDDFSYMAIAGIHGLPEVSWPKSNQPGKRYCAHAQATFPTWHTPYLLLFEQCLHNEMLDLIPTTYDEFEREEMIHAANTWRLPFWDWARRKPLWNSGDPMDNVNLRSDQGVGPNVPFLITQKNVHVKGRTRSMISLPNPLYQFALQEGDEFGKYGVKIDEDDNKHIAKCRVVSRHPPTKDISNPSFHEDYVEGRNQDWTKITAKLRGVVQDDITDQVEDKKKLYFANSLPEAVLRLFTPKDSLGTPNMPYDKFATSVWNPGTEAQDYPSLEGIHNNLHDFCGGDCGYMSNTATSAFDPLFWLHHCNIDRLLAIWHEIYPGAYNDWISSGPSSISRVQGPDTKLEPFIDKHGELFTSESCSYKHAEFNYTYPELQAWNFDDEQKYLSSIYAALKDLYSNSAQASLPLPHSSSHQNPQPAASIQASWSNIDYVVNVVYERFALNGNPFKVLIYLNPIPTQSPDNFSSERSLIGQVYNFSSALDINPSITTRGCQNCKSQRAAKTMCSGQVILTDHLIPHIGATLESLSKDDVVPFLRDNLHWHIVDSSGNVISKEDPRMSRLKVSVAAGRATHFAGPNELSRYEGYEFLWEVTTGRPAGAERSDLFPGGNGPVQMRERRDEVVVQARL